MMWNVNKCEVSKNVADKPKWKHIPSLLRQIVGEYFRLPEHSTGEIFVKLISRWVNDIEREIWRSKMECLYSGLGPKKTKLLVSCIAGVLVGTSPSKTVLIILSDGKDHCQEDLSNLLLRLDMQGYKRLTITLNSFQSEHWSSINAVAHDWKDVKRRVGITS
ncbi:hypothetical protein MLD38_013328 [Melastoma candidum]|uniref:Uncharacterized protein n=1 Tax=Melastoma candidum TaxID=119954 RepID=A0ACB9RB31_9MYRT|nr:hypothetical protein MLD38_013328 [Melastoma candidum]